MPFYELTAMFGRITKSVSFILTSRNDNYCGNSPERLFTSLYVLIELLKAYEVPNIEIILVDWNSTVPLSEHPCASRIDFADIVYKRISPEIAKKYAPDVHLSEVHALNVAVRISSGKLILHLDQDTIIGRDFIKLLKKCIIYEHHLDKLWWSGRRDTNETHYTEIINDPLTFLYKYDENIPIISPYEEKLFQNGDGAVGIFGVPRNLWVEEKGYNEQMTGWGHMELEFKDRLEKHTEWFNVDSFTSVDFYHIWHIKHNKVENDLEYSKYEPNDDNWGCLADLYTISS